MKVWAVFVDCTYTAPGQRWIDSEWAVQRAAIDRAVELERIFAAFGVLNHKTRVVEMSVVDAALKTKESKP